MKYMQRGFSHMGRKYGSILFVIWIALLSSCNSNRIYEENIDFENKQWLADSLPSFRFKIENAQKKYNIYWNIRNTISYPYQNLYLTYYLEDTLGHRIATDLHNMQLFAPKTGKPYGDGLGDIFSHQFLALPNYKFDSAGLYQIRLEQYMRTDTLSDIISVGIRVEEAETL